MPVSFLDEYIRYTSGIEPPVNYNRWSAIVGIGALLGRRYYFDHGHFKLFPNVYCMLIGSPGARKGTAIKLMKEMLSSVGYKNFAAERTSKEKFLMDMADSAKEKQSFDDALEASIFGGEGPDAEVFIAIDEINDFLGLGNMEFLSVLGNMWNFSGAYTSRTKTGKSIEIWNPTISLLGGNTPTNFAAAFPPEIFGQGFFSRLLIIHGEPSGRRITFPKKPPEEETRKLTAILEQIQTQVVGPATMTAGAEKLLDRIYQNPVPFDDVRFASYAQRRFDHLLKLCLIVSAARVSTTITEADVLYANTILSHAEYLMPKALGEFGKARDSDVSHRVLQIVQESGEIVTMQEIWKQVHKDLEEIQKLAKILQNLIEADKIQRVSVNQGRSGFLPKMRALEFTQSDTVDMSLLHPEERNAHV